MSEAAPAPGRSMPDGAPSGGRDIPVGGQAVIEGVMMRGLTTWAVAIRKPDGGIETSGERIAPWASRSRLLRLPIIRGVVALAEAMKIGFRAMGISTNARLAPGDEEEIGGFVWGLTILGALAIAIGVFFVLPVAVTSLFREQLSSAWIFWLVEGVLRVAVFVGYILALGRLRDLRRVFEFHGAEHKVISCFEAGDELTPRRAARYSRLHPRCGTSFLLVVMVITIFVLIPIGLPEWYWLIASRVFGVPLIAGIAYEAIKLAGRHRDKGWVRALIWPGLMLQNLTTEEPDESQLEVAIAALESVLDAEGEEILAASSEIEVVA